MAYAFYPLACSGNCTKAITWGHHQCRSVAEQRNPLGLSPLYQRSRPLEERGIRIQRVYHKDSVAPTAALRADQRMRRGVHCAASKDGGGDVVPSTRRPREERMQNTPSEGSESFATLKEEARRSNKEVFDRLIDAFLSRPSEDWRKLIAFSKQWPSLSKGFFERMEEKAKDASAAGNEDKSRELRRVGRRLKTVSDELAEYSKILEVFRAAPSRDWEARVTQHRASMGTEFFGYLELRIRAAMGSSARSSNTFETKEEGNGNAEGNDVHLKEAESLAALATQLAALVEAHDRVAADEDALDSAAVRFSELLQCDSMEAAEQKIDELSASGQLDPALLLTMAKAYAGVKETDATREEVKDIMAHLYFKAKETFAQQAPPEARILKFLISVESPKDRATLLEQALTPGMDFSTENEDFLHTTPDKLLNTIRNVLAVYDSSVKPESRQGIGNTAMAGQAAALMNPQVIERLRELEALLKKKYM